MTLISEKGEAARAALAGTSEPPGVESGRADSATGVDVAGAGRVSSTRRVIATGVLAAVAVLIIYAFFSAFVTHLWFQSRQRSMAALGPSQVAPKPGDPVGVIQVQAPFTVNAVIAEGDGIDQLRSGPGHRPGTPLPGALGNSVVYGRKSAWGGPFAGLGRAQPGTQIYVRTRLGPVLSYKVITRGLYHRRRWHPISGVQPITG